MSKPVKRTFATDENYAIQAAYVARNTDWSRTDIETMEPADLDAFTAALQAVICDENLEDEYEPTDDGTGGAPAQTALFKPQAVPEG